MLCADAVTAPPEHSHALSGVVQPGPGYILRYQGSIFCIVQQSPQEKYRAVGIVASGKVLVFLDIVGDVAVGIPDTLVAPDRRFHRCPQADADIHPQKARIQFFQILFHHRYAALPFLSFLIKSGRVGVTGFYYSIAKFNMQVVFFWLE